MVERFKALGFESKGDYTELGEEYFTLDKDGKRICSIHTFQQDNPHVARMLGFRDYLLSHPEAVKEYIEIKKGLLAEFGENDYKSYDIEKGKRMEPLKAKADEWREE